jgi:hypothetical protein
VNFPRSLLFIPPNLSGAISQGKSMQMRSENQHSWSAAPVLPSPPPAHSPRRPLGIANNCGIEKFRGGVCANLSFHT